MKEQYNVFGFEILKKLNELYLEDYPQLLSSSYRNKCKNEFDNINSDPNITSIKDDLYRRLQYNQIEYFSDPGIKNITKDKLISLLINGKLAITSYGRTFIDNFFTVNRIEVERNNLILKIEKERENIENIKSNLLGQVFTLMGVFVAIITFLYQGISLMGSNLL